MVQTKLRFQSFEEYLRYEDDNNRLYELFNGELVELPPESGQNVQIANRLFLMFALLLGTDRVRGNGLEVEVNGEPRNRYPDLTIIRDEHIELLAKRNTIRLNMSRPLLVVEITLKDTASHTSPGEIQRNRDYVAKRMQYQDCAIPEYWIVDPQTQTVLILELQQQTYHEVGSFTGEQQLISPQFSQLKLTPTQIFAAAN